MQGLGRLDRMGQTRRMRAVYFTLRNDRINARCMAIQKAKLEDNARYIGTCHMDQQHHVRLDACEGTGDDAEAVGATTHRRSARARGPRKRRQTPVPDDDGDDDEEDDDDYGKFTSAQKKKPQQQQQQHATAPQTSPPTSDNKMRVPPPQQKPRVPPPPPPQQQQKQKKQQRVLSPPPQKQQRVLSPPQKQRVIAGSPADVSSGDESDEASCGQLGFSLPQSPPAKAAAAKAKNARPLLRARRSRIESSDDE
jgi:hypothetical protein